MNRLFWVSVGKDELKLNKNHKNEAYFVMRGTGDRGPGEGV